MAEPEAKRFKNAAGEAADPPQDTSDSNRLTIRIRVAPASPTAPQQSPVTTAYGVVGRGRCLCLGVA